MSTDRRDFLKQVATAAAVTSTTGNAEGGQNESASGPGETSAPIGFPREFRGDARRTIAYPLGGIGTGSISLGGRGELRDWEIYNRPDKGNSPYYAFPSIWVHAEGAEPAARVLEGRITPPYERENGLGLGSGNVPGLPRLADSVFTGEFPFARVSFEDESFPVEVELEAWSPFIPGDEEGSGIPVAILDYRARNTGSRSVEVSISYNLDNPVGVGSRFGSAGRRNVYRESEGLRGLFMDNPFMDSRDPLQGSFALCALGNPGEVTHLTGWRGGSRWRVAPLAFWDDFSEDGSLDAARHPIPQPIGSVCLRQTIAPGGEQHFRFLLAWHFPNRTPERCGWATPWPRGEKPEGQDDLIGNHYCQQYENAWVVAEDVRDRLEELETGTRDFVETMKSTSLPPVVLDAAMSNLSTLRTNTCFRTSDGGFHVFEGCNDHSGCCSGSCTHVWNYESMLAFLFPTLSRSLRERQFERLVDERGAQEFRYFLPYSDKRYTGIAADGQMGTLMKLYLDWKLSGDTAWLRRLWPGAKRAIEFAWIEHGWDGDQDGVMEGVQHNTYDIEFYGPNPLSGIWYLGALRAAEEIARAAGDEQAAEKYRQLSERGRRWIDEDLFNGEFYIQQVRGWPASEIADDLKSEMGAADPEKPDFQMGEGCLADQVLGQYFAKIAGLGDLVDVSKARQALLSIHKYNFKSDLSGHESVQRTYALNDEAGLLLCDYAGRPRPTNPFPYYAEVWTGIEYQVAAHMCFEGMVEQGLEIFEAVRRRHDGAHRNPWDEPECGHHYGRALASWSGVLSLSGFDYSAPEQAVVIAPRTKADRFRGFWSTPTGWGTVTKTASAGSLEITIEARRGDLNCRLLRVDQPGLNFRTATATLGDQAIATELQEAKSGLTATMQSVITVTRDRPFRLRLT